MPRFFTTDIQFDEAAATGSAWISGEDGRHIARALRMRVGESLTLSDGCGNDYFGTVAGFSGDTVTVALHRKAKNESEPKLFVTLYPGMPKSDKLELVVQKATELGVSRIVPVMTERSISRPDEKSAKKRQERLQRIALEAAKQSGRGTVPEIGALCSFSQAIQNAAGTKILFYEGGGVSLSACVQPQTREVSVFIGPEGGFDPAEVQLAKENGALAATLGPRILRTETAPLAALSILLYITGDME